MTPRLLLALLLLSVPGVAMTAGNTVAPSLAGQTEHLVLVDELKPQACASLLAVIRTGPSAGVGTDSNDLVLGRPTSDDLAGGDGDDCIIGGAGDDAIDGGLGTDTCIGGAGTDVMTGCETELP